jgi:hypothetical protein
VKNAVWQGSWKINSQFASKLVAAGANPSDPCSGGPAALGKPNSEWTCAQLARGKFECNSYMDDRLVRPKGGRFLELAFPKAGVAQGVAPSTAVFVRARG